MPVSLEQWRASVGTINAGRSRVLAKCIKGSPRSGCNLDLILFLLVMAPLVMCCCVGAWLVIKWGGPVKHGKLLKRYRREDGLRQCLLLGVVCCEGWLLHLQCAHGEGMWPHETDKHPQCLSESSSHLSTLGVCGQYLNVVFHMVMVTLLYLCGDVEKNPGPPFELIPCNLEQLHTLLKFSGFQENIDALAHHLRVQCDRRRNLRGILKIWLDRKKNKPSWHELGVAAIKMDCYEELTTTGVFEEKSHLKQDLDQVKREHDIDRTLNDIGYQKAVPWEPRLSHNFEQKEHVLRGCGNRNCPKHGIHASIAKAYISEEDRWVRNRKLFSERFENDPFHMSVHRRRYISNPADGLPANARLHLKLELDHGEESVDKNLNEIADCMLGLEKLLSFYVKLDTQSMEGSKLLQRRNTLKLWKAKFGRNATYGKLLNILVNSGHAELVEVLCDLLKKKCYVGAAETVMDNTDVGFLIEYLTRYSRKWKLIGSALHFLPDELETISIKHSIQERCLFEVLSLWVKWPTAAHSQVPTLEMLCDALRSDWVELGALASHLYDKKNRLPSQHKSGVLHREVTSAELEEADAKQLLDDAMKDGYVTSQSIVIVLIGIAGSGKSSFKRLVLNLPSEERVSTGLAEAAIRNISISRAIIDDTNSDTIQWEVVESEKLLSMLADVIKKGIPKTVESSVKPQDISDSTNISQTGSSHESVHHPSHDDGNPDSVRDSDLPPNSAVQQDSDEFDFKDDLLPLIRKSKGSGKLLGVHWVYLIDTGGQPQFLQLLPAFIRNISSCVCFVRLDQGLDDKPLVKFFDKSGKQCGKSYSSEQTNFQVVESCVRTIYSRCCLSSDQPPNFFVVGTHHDEYMKNETPETIEEKNRRLRTHLYSILKDSLTFYKADEVGKVIFPLNCKNPGDEDQAVAAEFRKCVMNYCPEPKGEIPLAWFVLEERIRQYAVKKKVAYIEKDTCSKIGSTLNMSNETFQTALNHLLKLNIFRNYSSVPNLIFCDTQVVLFKLTELVQYSFNLRETTIYGVKGSEINFKNEGIINIAFLSKFPEFFSGNFTPECFIKILCELLAIADMHDGKYFMPCLLKELNENEIQEHRNCSELLSPLLLSLDNGCLPNGLFTSLIASLQNDHAWSLSSKESKSACLYRNCVEFNIPGGLPGVIILIDSFEYIEIHISSPCVEELDNVCVRVFNDVESGLLLSWKLLYPRIDPSFKPAFFCNCSSCPSQLHHATISECGKYEKCSLDPKKGTKLSDSKLRWLKGKVSDNIVDQNIDTSISSTNLTPQENCPAAHSMIQDTHPVSESVVRDEPFDLDLEMVDDSKFDRNDDMADVVEAVESLAANWAKLALKLHLKNDDIKTIKTNNPGDSDACLNDALALWLKENYNTKRFGHPSWRTLVKTLLKMDNQLAHEIASSHRVKRTRSDSDSENKGCPSTKRTRGGRKQ